jgi:hypothetical protein
LILLSITDPGGSSVLKRVLPAASASRRKSNGGRAIARAVLPPSKIYRSGFGNSFERAPEIHRSESGNAFERASEVFKRGQVTQKGGGISSILTVSRILEDDFKILRLTATTRRTEGWKPPGNISQTGSSNVFERAPELFVSMQKLIGGYGGILSCVEVELAWGDDFMNPSHVSQDRAVLPPPKVRGRRTRRSSEV